MVLGVAREHTVHHLGGLVELPFAGENARAQQGGRTEFRYGRQCRCDGGLRLGAVAQRTPGDGQLGLEGRLRGLVGEHGGAMGEHEFLVVALQHQRLGQGRQHPAGRQLCRQSTPQLDFGTRRIARREHGLTQQQPQFDGVGRLLHRRLVLDHSGSVLPLRAEFLARGHQGFSRPGITSADGAQQQERSDAQGGPESEVD